MTILGKHTIDEARMIMRTAEFRMERAKTLINLMPFTKENVQLVKDWNEFVEVRWKNAHNQAQAGMLSLKLANPLVPENSMPCEKEYMLIIHAMNKQEGLIQKGDLSDLIGRLEKASGQSLDESGHPVPAGFDPDLAAYQEVDKRIKAGEKTAKDVGEAAKGAAKSNIGLIIGLSALGIAGVVVATKVYL
jgi:hypothetical protein